MSRLPARRLAEAPPFVPPAFALPPGVEVLRTPPAGFSLIGPATALDGILVRAQRAGALFVATAAKPYGDGRAFVNVKPIELQRPVAIPQKAWLRRRWKPALATTGSLVTAVAWVAWIFRAAIMAAIETALIAAAVTLLILLLVGLGVALTSGGDRGHCSGPNSGH